MGAVAVSTLELFATSIVAAFFLGALVGAFAMSLMIAAAERRDRAYARHLRRELRKVNERTERVVWQTKHLGTPYRPETIEAALLGPDTHNGSRKAPAPLEVVK